MESSIIVGLITSPALRASTHQVLAPVTTNCSTVISTLQFSPDTAKSCLQLAELRVLRGSVAHHTGVLLAMTLLDSSYVQVPLEVPQSHEQWQPVQMVPFHSLHGSGTQTSSSGEELPVQDQFSHTPGFP